MNKHIITFFVFLFINIVFHNARTDTPPFSKYHLGNGKAKTYEEDSAFIAKSDLLIDVANKVIRRNLIPRGFSGSCLIALDGKVILNYCSGYVNFETKELMKPSTPLHVASITKTFTSMGVLRLHQLNKLSIYDPVAKYLEIFPFDNITILDLLCHRSGIADYEYYIDFFWKKKNIPMSNDDLIDYLPSICTMRFHKPQERFEYSNTNYAILALIIEKVSGLSYEEYLDQQFFKPLNMQNTFVFRLKDSAHVPPSYYSNYKPIPFNFKDGIVGDKGVYSSTEDLLKWDQALYDATFFPDSIYQLAFEPYSIKINRKRKGFSGYGLGWRLRNVKNPEEKIVYHNGWWHGNKSMFVRRTSDHLTLIALSNKYSNSIYSLNQVMKVD